MRAILKYFLKNPFLVNVAIAFIILLGLMIGSRMRSTYFPPQKIKFITVDVLYRGASPSEVEEGIINKIEDNLKEVTGIDRVTSTALENKANISIELLHNAKVSTVLEDVKNAVNSITTFPKNADKPVIKKQEIQDHTVTMALSGNVSLATLKDHAKKIRADFLKKPGLSKVFIRGYPEEEIEIRLKENDMRRYKLSFDEVVTAVRNANLEVSGGELKTPSENILIRANEKGYYAKDLQNLVIKATTNGQIVYLKNIAEVENRFADQPNKRFLNGLPAVALEIYTLNNESILDNHGYIKKYIEDFNKDNSQIKAQIVLDSTIPLIERIEVLTQSGIIGVILVIIVLTLFLNRSLALWVSFKIPVALLGMVIIASFVDLTINALALFGTIIVLGILVDDGVVIGENIYQHAIERGKSRFNAAIDGTIEVIPAVLSSLLTTATAFSIYFYIEGLMGEFFSNISIVVIATLFVAMIESFFFLPVHIAHSAALKKNTKTSKLEIITNRALYKLRNHIYVPALAFAQKRYMVVIGLAVLTLFGAIYLRKANILKGTFFPNIDGNVVEVRLTLPPGTPEEITDSSLQHIEEAAWLVNQDYKQHREDNIVLNVERIIGPNSNEGSLNIHLLPVEQRRLNSIILAGKFRDKAGPISNALSLSYGPPAMVFGKPVSISLLGNDLSTLRKAKEELKSVMGKRTDIKGIVDSDKTGIKEYYITLKQNAHNLGITLGEVMRQLRSGFFGVEVQNLQRGDEETKVWLRYDYDERRSIEKFKDIQLRLANNITVPLSEVVNIHERPGTLSIKHQQGQTEITIGADIANPNVTIPDILGGIEHDVLREITQKYPGVTYSFEGESRESGKSMKSMMEALPIILILMVLIVLVNFKSISQTIVVFLLFPFMLVGVFAGHLIHGIPLSILSIQGIIALTGILINNSLVLVSTVNQALKEKTPFSSAIFNSAKSRFRAILLTTITTIVGLMPLILSKSFGAQFLKPTAISIAYGLAFGIFITLLLLPALLVANNKLKQLAHLIWEGKKTSPEAVESAIKRRDHQINQINE